MYPKEWKLYCKIISKILKKIEFFEDISNIIKEDKYIQGYRGGNYA